MIPYQSRVSRATERLAILNHKARTLWAARRRIVRACGFGAAGLSEIEALVVRNSEHFFRLVKALENLSKRHHARPITQPDACGCDDHQFERHLAESFHMPTEC